MKNSKKLGRPFYFSNSGKLIPHCGSKHYDEIKIWDYFEYMPCSPMPRFLSRSRRQRIDTERARETNVFIMGLLSRRVNMQTCKYQDCYKFETYLTTKEFTDIRMWFKVFHVSEYPDNFYRYRHLTEDKKQQLMAVDEIMDRMDDDEFLRQVSEL